nr:hypothetical protein [Candidatus Njordarchaeum guaymaensis]
MVPSVKDRVELELVKEMGAHPEIRVNGKELSADYNNFETLKKALLAALGKIK